MKKTLTLLLTLAISFASVYAMTNDAPHGNANTIGCIDCHPAGYVPPVDSVCLQCHINGSGGGYSKNNAPKVVTHSSATTDTKYGVWSAKCIDCHYMHEQAQFTLYGSYLGSGVLISVSDNGNGTASFGYTGFSALKPEYSDYTKWGAKSGSDRGLIIYPNPSDLTVSYEILSATADTIMVKGPVSAFPAGAVSAGNTFRLTFGQNIRYGVKYPTTLNPAGDVPVYFFDKTGPNSFAFDESGTHSDPTPDGICQVCHDQTGHWRRDGTVAAVGVHADQNGTRCTTCHQHADGFSASGACTACHGMPPVTNAMGGPNGLAINEGGTGAMSVGPHEKHATASGLNYPCVSCHDGGMPGSRIYDKSIQIGFSLPNGSKTGTYDGRATLANGYQYAAGNAGTTVTQGGTRTCSNISCHGAGTPQWGSSAGLGCGSCHLGPADVDNFSGTFWNNGTAGIISAGEWGATGHGLASGTYASGNAAAGFTSANACTYCHDSSVGHNDGTNTFRLRNLGDATWGMNGNCQSCHATGSAGVTVDGVLKNGISKIDSLHNDKKHIAKGGGQFCWDCHDPHGDGNRFMIHSAVAQTSDAATGAPLTTVPVVFTASATGTDYAKSAAPFNGVCNVCHTTTMHYTSASGDGHNAGLVCTQCHKHNGKTATDAFSGGDCIGCHSVQQGGRVPVVGQLSSNSHHIQGVTLTSQHCYQCHWEANSDGSVSSSYHGGPSNPGAPVNLVIYGNGTRPTTYAVGTTAVEYTAGAGIMTITGTSPIAVVDTWRNLTTNGSGSTRTASFTAGAGSAGNRMVIIGMGWEDSHTSGCNPSSITGNYGGQTIMTINEANTSNNRVGQWMGYVRETGIAARSNNTITVTFSGCTPDSTPTMSVATYEGVDQSSAPASVVASGTTGSSFAWSGLSVIKNGYSMFNLTADGITSFTPPSGYIERYDAATTNFRMTGGDKAITADGTESGSVAGNTSSSRWGLVAVSVKPAVVSSTVDATRTEMQKINQHCLGCHSAANNTTQPFGDGKTPKQFAWDSVSIAERYSQTGTTPWGKYSGANVTPKNTQTKAFSAHGNAANNMRGWNTMESWPNTGGTVNVLCFDCHNSHGSGVVGTTTSYDGKNGTTNGGILKDTTANVGGYKMTYRPAAGGSAATRNTFNAGAGLCFDCHMNQNSGTAPWGYKDTFGAAQLIMGYNDSPYFGAGLTGPQQRYAFKAAVGQTKGGHFGASASLKTPANGTIGGLCTPCHDPHGVSPTLGTNQAYGVPLLKGTYMTSPYKEEAAPGGYISVGGGGDDGRGGTDKASAPGYRLDENTFASSWSAGTSGKITQTDAQFGGLCLKCHPKSSLSPTTGGAWKSKERIHNTVKGWGGSGGNANNAVHAFTCSKCHTPHNSALPRLMVSNCLDYSHRGRVASGGAPNRASGSGEEGRGSGGFPAGGAGKGGSLGFGVLSCHDNTNSSGWPANQRWNTVTPWGAAGTTMNSGGRDSGRGSRGWGGWGGW